MKHGKGKWVKPKFTIDKFTGNKIDESTTYEGCYANDKKNGYGVFNWGTGSKYEGEFKDDERDGFGKM